MRKISTQSDCPLTKAIHLLGDSWCLLILREIMMGAQRFSVIHERLNIAKNILSDRLKFLVEQDILSALNDENDARCVTYRLTKKGEELFIVFVGLRQWAEKWEMQPGEIKSFVVERRGLKPIPPIQIQSQSGDTLSIKDIVVIGH